MFWKSEFAIVPPLWMFAAAADCLPFPPPPLLGLCHQSMGEKERILCGSKRTKKTWGEKEEQKKLVAALESLDPSMFSKGICIKSLFFFSLSLSLPLSTFLISNSLSCLILLWSNYKPLSSPCAASTFPHFLQFAAPNLAKLKMQRLCYYSGLRLNEHTGQFFQEPFKYKNTLGPEEFALVPVLFLIVISGVYRSSNNQK